MEQGFIDILKKLIKEQGSAALTDEKKCKAFLADYTRNDYKKESRLLVQAVEAGVAKTIDGAEDLVSCKKAQIRILEEEYSLNSAVVADVVNTLALVLKGQENKIPQNTVCVKCGKELMKEWKSCPYCSTPTIKIDQMIDDEFTEAIRLDPNNASTYFRRGDVYANKQQWDAALNDYTEVIRLNPNDDNVYLRRGDVYYRKEQWDAAIKDLTEVIRLNPNNAYVYHKRGFAYIWKDQYDMAIKDFTEAVKLDPNNPEFQESLQIFFTPAPTIQEFSKRDYSHTRLSKLFYCLSTSI